jgi:hypothetical protein
MKLLDSKFVSTETVERVGRASSGSATVFIHPPAAVIGQPLIGSVSGSDDWTVLGISPTGDRIVVYASAATAEPLLAGGHHQSAHCGPFVARLANSPNGQRNSRAIHARPANDRRRVL